MLRLDCLPTRTTPLPETALWSEIMTPKERILAWIEEDRDELIKFLSAFVAIPSPNPPGDTRPAADFLLAQLRAKGVPVGSRFAKEHLPNVVGSFDGGSKRRHLVLNGH